MKIPADSLERCELRNQLAMAICGAPDVDLNLVYHLRRCVCKRDAREVTDAIPQCAASLAKADAVLRILDILD